MATAVLTLKAGGSFASSGSGRAEKGNNGGGNGEDPQPSGNPPINDGWAAGLATLATANER